MPKYRIEWDFDGQHFEEVIEKDTLEEAEWEASDQLRDLINTRTSYSATEITD